MGGDITCFQMNNWSRRRLGSRDRCDGFSEEEEEEEEEDVGAGRVSLKKGDAAVRGFDAPPGVLRRPAKG